MSEVIGQVYHAFVNVPASQTDYSVVAGVANRKIRVLSAVIQDGGTATTIVFNTQTPSAAGTAITATLSNPANNPNILPHSDFGWFETNPGDNLTATTGAGSATGVTLVYALP